MADRRGSIARVACPPACVSGETPPGQKIFPRGVSALRWVHERSRPGPREFATTHWSLVVAAKPDEASQTRARKALEELCRAYWYPLYAFVRNRGYSSDDAQDLTQSFFARIIETGGFASADPERGRFRSYLLGAMKHFLANEWHRAQAQKRGGGVTFLELGRARPGSTIRSGTGPVDRSRCGFRPGMGPGIDRSRHGAAARGIGSQRQGRAVRGAQGEPDRRGTGPERNRRATRHDRGRGEGRGASAAAALPGAAAGRNRGDRQRSVGHR